jgi:hypothetical protein
MLAIMSAIVRDIILGIALVATSTRDAPAKAPMTVATRYPPIRERVVSILSSLA